MDDKEKLIRKHEENYKNIVVDMINNNTKILVEEDLLSLVNKPPLDSMDLLKSKFLSTGKKYNFLINTEKLEYMLQKYRENIVKNKDKLIKYRVTSLEKLMKKTDIKSGEEYKFLKKDLNSIDKHIKDELKIYIEKCLDKYILANILDVINDELDDFTKDKISVEINKFIKKDYYKQLLESVDVKLLVKDTTLINNLKESGTRFKITLDNLQQVN